MNVPVTADIESGYGQDDETIVGNVLKVAAIGAVGINIEDSLKGDAGLKDPSDQGRLLFKLREALIQGGFDRFYINARIDTYLQNQDRNQSPLEETLRRSHAYAENGASGIFVPGIRDAEEIRTVASRTPAPLNVMALPGLVDCEELQKLGVRRLSLGGSVYRRTFKLLEQFAKEMANTRNVSQLFE